MELFLKLMMINSKQRNEPKIINVTSTKSISGESPIIRRITFLLCHCFCCFVIYVENTMDENEHILQICDQHNTFLEKKPDTCVTYGLAISQFKYITTGTSQQCLVFRRNHFGRNASYFSMKRIKANP